MHDRALSRENREVQRAGSGAMSCVASWVINWYLHLIHDYSGLSGSRVRGVPVKHARYRGFM